MKLIWVLLLVFAGVFILQQISLRWAKPLPDARLSKMRVWIIVLVLLNIILLALSRFI
ncbi:MAG: hypothetical protein H7A08_04745 [Oceanospirillaceae bacterium]|nr:hypothetical protein [Oceanospirillaceae bacterium]MCP5350032.1 hypothetical protein [Oceanospirillaceae bacterium]